MLRSIYSEAAGPGGNQGRKGEGGASLACWPAVKSTSRGWFASSFAVVADRDGSETSQPQIRPSQVSTRQLYPHGSSVCQWLVHGASLINEQAACLEDELFGLCRATARSSTVAPRTDPRVGTRNCGMFAATQALEYIASIVDGPNCKETRDIVTSSFLKRAAIAFK